jgi:phosphatidate cytidylyltransferase
MADDERTEDGSGGFDDWLDEEPGPATDPYAALADDDDGDDAEAEIADWMAFTEGSDVDAATASDEGSGEKAADVLADDADSPVSDVTDDTGDDAEEGFAAADAPAGSVDADHKEAFDPDAVAAIPVIRVDTSSGAVPTANLDDEADDADDEDGADDEVLYAAWDTDDETQEIPITDSADDEADDEVDDRVDDEDGHEDEMVPATSVELDEFDGGGRPDTEEVPIIAGVDGVPDVGPAPIVDDTGEMDVIPFPDPEALADETGENVIEHVGEDLDDAFEGEDDSLDGVFDLSQEHYVQTATREHAGLAAAIAEADNEDTQQVALAAAIPGLEPTVVGFEDVVEAEGHTKVRARASGDLIARVITAVVLIAALAASLLWRPALVALATVVFVIGAGEFYTALTRSGRHPISLFGFIGIVAASVGGFVWGAVAIPTAFLIVTTMLLLFYAVVPGRSDPMGNLALTITVMAWAGLGTYAMLIAVSEDYQTLVVGVVVTVATMDIAQYFIGRAIGRHQLSPWVSPKKTIEGLVAGVIVALAIGALLHFFPPFELTSGLAVGAAVAVLSPLGDLAMSAAKRILGLKDMGSILPGHGGFLDRIDGLLFVIPAACVIFVWAGLL